MTKRTLQISITVAAVVVLLLVALAHFGPSVSNGKVKADNSGASLTPLQQKLLSGYLSSELEAHNSPTNSPSPKPSNYYPDHADDQCSLNLGSNIKVNQNCLNLSDPDLQGRAQANNETAIAVNPNNSSDLVSSNNDYRRGDGTCGSGYTLDGANHWNDSTVPNGFTRAQPTYSSAPGVSRQYWEAGGDTSVAWDSKGNAYLDCQVFNRGMPPTTNPDVSSGIYVFRSTQNNGASWNFTGRPVVEQLNTGPSIVPLLDKPYMTIDNHAHSLFQDRIYVTWTLFASNGTANIYEAHSNDYGEHFSAPVLVSTTSATLCPNPVPGDTAGSCDANQFSDPFTGSDGALYVAYINGNNATPASDNNQYQILISKSTDGGQSFGAPVLVSPYNDLPDCATYQSGQDNGRSCVPEKGSRMNSVFRAVNYPSGQVNPNNPQQVIVTFGSYISKDSNPSNGCIPSGFSSTGNPTYTGVKTPGACNNKILESASSNGGTTFTGTTATDPTTLTVVSSAPNQKTTDQWWQWAAFSKSGKLAVSYYDRQYGSDETTGNMDVSLSGAINDPTIFGVVRVTSSSMPLPTEFPDAQGNSVFFGDYSGLDAATSAYPIWMDTRDKDLFACPNPANPGTILTPPQVCRGVSASGIPTNDQDIFMATVSIP